VFLGFANGSLKVAVARLVEGTEEDEGLAVLHVQDAVLLAGETSPELSEARALDGARIREPEARPEDLKAPDRARSLLGASPAG